MENLFWSRVLDLLERKDIPRKEFAHEVGISYSSIHNGIERNSIPSADVALKIAYVLDVSLEYLVLGTQNEKSNFYSENKIYLKNRENILYRKNQNLIEAIESLPENLQNSIREMIINTANIVSKAQEIENRCKK